MKSDLARDRSLQLDCAPVISAIIFKKSPNVLFIFRHLGFPTSRAKMPVTVSPALRFSRYAALLIGVAYGYKRNEYLKPYGAKDRKMQEKKLEEQAELKRLRDAANAGKSIFDS